MLVLSCLAFPYFILSCVVLSCRVLSYLACNVIYSTVICFLVLPCLFLSCSSLTLSVLLLPFLVLLVFFCHLLSFSLFLATLILIPRSACSNPNPPNPNPNHDPKPNPNPNPNHNQQREDTAISICLVFCSVLLSYLLFVQSSNCCCLVVFSNPDAIYVPGTIYVLPALTLNLTLTPP